MGKNKYRFKGHESFILREGWLNKGLYEVDRNPKVFSENYGADALGVGPNMAKAIRYWLRAAELVTDSPKTGVMLTAIGQLILAHDPCHRQGNVFLSEQMRNSEYPGNKLFFDDCLSGSYIFKG